MQLNAAALCCQARRCGAHRAAGGRRRRSACYGRRRQPPATPGCWAKAPGGGTAAAPTGGLALPQKPGGRVCHQVSSCGRRKCAVPAARRGCSPAAVCSMWRHGGAAAPLRPLLDGVLLQRRLPAPALAAAQAALQIACSAACTLIHCCRPYMPSAIALRIHPCMQHTLM